MSSARIAAIGLLAAAAGSLSWTTVVGAEFAELARRVPDDANAVIVVNAASLYASPLGQKEGWQAKYADAFEAAPMVLPPSAERGILSAEFDLASLRPDWQAAVMDLSVDPSAAEVARRRGGLADVIDGFEAVWFPGNICVIRFAPRVVGLLVPANRQEASRWAVDVKSGHTGSLSPYLEQAVGYADTVGTQVVLGIDLAGAFGEARVRAALADSQVLQGVSPDAAAKILASIQGVKLGVLVNDKLNGALRLDFSEDAAPLAPIAKPLVLKAVAKAGAMLPEFNDWTAETKGASIELRGDLTADGMRRIFSLLALDTGAIESPGASVAETATTTTTSVDAAKASMGKASLRYFRGVSRYVEDIQRLERANSLDQAVVWIENYARKVESLPTRNVDPELIEYGKYVAATFRQIVDEASGAINQADAAQQPVVTNYKIGWLPTADTVNYGGNFQRRYAAYGNMDIDPQATQQNIQKSEEQLYQTMTQAKQSLSQLVADNATVRTKLTEKYGLKF